jgi:hypothetical protein
MRVNLFPKERNAPMRIALLLLVVTSAHARTAPFSRGSWTLRAVECSNPAYVFTPDEQAFIDAMNSGASIDRYDFTSPSQGVYRQKMGFPQFGVHCIGESPFTVSYPAEGQALFTFSYTNWKVFSTKPNTTIKCDDEGPHQQHVKYRWQGTSFVFHSPTGDSCVEHRLVWAKE